MALTLSWETVAPGTAATFTTRADRPGCARARYGRWLPAAPLAPVTRTVPAAVTVAPVTLAGAGPNEMPERHDRPSALRKAAMYPPGPRPRAAKPRGPPATMPICTPLADVRVDTYRQVVPFADA